MTRRLRLVVATLALLLLSTVTALAVPDSPVEFAPVQKGFVTAGEEVLPYAPDRILVKFTAEGMARSRLDPSAEKGAALPGVETGLASIDELNREAGVTKISRAFIQPANKGLADQLGVHRVYMFEFAKVDDIPALAERFAADPGVEYATPDWRAFPDAVPNDPYHAENWGHNNTAQLPDLDWGGTYDHTLPTTVGTPGFDSNAEAAWNDTQGFGSASVIVAILDSGVDIDHDDLRLVAGYDYGDNDSNPDDNSASPGHGTCCAGVAAAVVNNAMEVNGIAGGCSVMPLKVMNSAGSMYFSSIVNAIYHAADHGADMASMSFSADISSEPSTDAALQYAYNAGVVLLAATSNANQSHIRYPANNAYVIGVGAASPCGERKRSSSNAAECNPGVLTDPNGYTCDGERWWGSNYGVTTPDAAGAVDIIAPTILPTTDIEGSGGYRSGDVEPFFNGTSCATPYAAGVCALIKSKFPTWTNVQIRDQLCSTAQDIISVESGAGWDRYTGYGMVDAAAAVGGGGPPPPVADFSGTPTSGCAPLSVAFTDASTGDVTSWNWNFGDTGTSTAQNPNHTYTAAGTYTVTLTATGPGGSDGETKTGYITVTEVPVANYSGTPTSGGAPLTVNFTDLSTGGPASWSWDFGDTGTSSAQNPSHTYTAPGTYSVTLTASNACGSDIETRVDYITVTVPPPVADFTGTPTSGCAPLSVAFTDASTGDVTSWSWDFGDTGTSTGQNPNHTYAAAGTYTVTLTATGPGGSDGETKTDYITVYGPPVAAFSGSPTGGTAPLTVNFTDLSSGNPTAWSWDFGDGVGASTQQNPSYTYNAIGLYTVTLTVTGACGGDSETKVDYINVTEEVGPTIARAAGETTLAGVVTGDYTNTFASDNVYEVITEQAYGGHPRKTYSYCEHRWDFSLISGTAVTFYLEAYRPNNADGDNFVFEYSTDGAVWNALATVASATEQVYSAGMPSGLSGAVTVRVTDTNHSWGTTSNDPVYVDDMYIAMEGTGPVPPLAEFAGSPISGTAPLTVDFTDLSTGSPDSWSWDFGDGVGTSTQQNPSYTYDSIGTYTVSLTVTNAYGTDGETKIDYITVTETGNTMSVYDIAVTRAKVGPNYVGVGVITIRDNNGNPVAGATVYAMATGPDGGSYSGPTGADGTVTFQTGGVKKPSGEWCFEVTNVTHATQTYDPGSNNVTKSCESGDVFKSAGEMATGNKAAGDGATSDGIESQPCEFAVGNYPNPFNPMTEIHFSLPVDAQVKLEIYNIVGQRVAVLTDRGYSAGSHSVMWDATAHPSGLYFYRLRAGEKIVTDKMMLLK
jgi:PKD repeat protein